MRKRLGWVNDQYTHVRRQVREHGVLWAAAERLGELVDRSPYHARILERTDAATIDRREIDHVQAATAELAVHTDQVTATLDATRRELAELARRLDRSVERAHDAQLAMIDLLWLTHQPLRGRPLISVVVPTIHVERAPLLRSAIDSVLAQTYTEWELIVVDDAPEGVLAALPTWWPDDDRVRVVHAGRSNAAEARSIGLSTARGEVVAYLDDDCRWFPWWLHTVAATFAAESELDVVHGLRVVEDRASGPWVHAARLDELSVHVSNPVDTNVLAHHIRVRDPWRSLDSCADYDLSVRLATARSRPLPVPAAVYGTTAPDRIWSTSRAAANATQVAAVRRNARRNRPLRIVAHNALYPLLSESYIGDELAGLAEHDVDIVISREYRHEYDCPSAIDGPIFDSLTSAIEHHDPDAVLMHWAGTAFANRATCAAHGVPWIVRLHSFDGAGDLSDLVDPWCAAVFTFPHQHFAHPLRRHLDTLIREPHVPFEGPRARRIASASAGLPKKGWDTLFDAMDLIHPTPLEIVVATTNGFESLPDDLAATLAGRGLPGRVSRDLPYADTQEIIRTSGALVYAISPGVGIGQPRSIIEAMLAATPVVVPEIEAIGALVGDVGHYYEPGSATSLAEAMRGALDAPEPFEQRVAAAARVRTRHAGGTAVAAWADSVTEAVVRWHDRQRRDRTSRSLRAWQTDDDRVVAGASSGPT